MAIWIKFGIEATGTDLEIVKDWVESVVVWHEDPIIWSVPADETEPFGESAGIRVEGTSRGQGHILVIEGESKYAPPLYFAGTIARQFPTLIVRIAGVNDAEGRFDEWECKGGEARVINCVEYCFMPDGKTIEIVYARDGEQFFRFPKWIGAEDTASLPEADRSHFDLADLV